MAVSHPISTRVVLEAADLDYLVTALAERGYTVLGPTVRDAVIVWSEIEGVADLPAGVGDAQEGGVYRLHPRDDDALFGYAVGPTSPKKFLYPPRTVLWEADRTGHGTYEIRGQGEDPPWYAFLGVRPCELAAIGVQDRVFLEATHPDPTYSGRRADAFIAVVNCGDPSGTCFCASMGTGPRARRGYDLALTELIADPAPGLHAFLVEVGSPTGAEVLVDVPTRRAEPEDEAAAERVTERAAGRMGRTMDTADLPGLLRTNPESSRWADVGNRCLTCGNCTASCPTCFCSTLEDVADITGDTVSRHRTWDSCFTLDFSYIHGGVVRPRGRARYRQWLTHKLDTWVDQFGTSGCVGCGRCITWCPVGIDLTAEVAAIRQIAAAQPDGEQRGGRS